MHLTVVTPERVTFQDEVDEVTIPTVEGEITILKNHVPLVAMLKAGAAKVKKGATEYFLAMSGGFLQVQPGNKIVVLADTAERAEELDEQKIEEARKAAEKALSEARAFNEVEYATLAANLERELARLKVARKKRHGGGSVAPESET